MNNAKISRSSIPAVEAIANHTGTKSTDLPFLLADVVDPDTLDSLFHGRATDGQVTFGYDGVTVTVSSDGHVQVKDESER